MPKKISILLLSLIVAFGFMSGGYGYWQKKLVIDGSGIVVKQVERELATLSKTFTGNDDGQMTTQINEEDIISEDELSGINNQNTGNGVEDSYEGNAGNLGNSGDNSGQGTDSDNEGSSNENGNNESGNNESNNSESGSSESGNSGSDSSDSSNSDSGSSDSGSSASGTSDAGGGDSGGSDPGSSDSGSSNSGSGDSTGE
jgi:hypothetical protein